MKKLFIFFVALCCYVQAEAQSLSKTGVLSIKLRNFGPIIQSQEVKGYYYFYNVEKADRKNNNYQLSVVDENLREINSVNIVRPKTYFLVDGAFNGNAFAFMFYDFKNKSIELIGYDQTLKESGKAIRKVTNKYAQAAFNLIAQGGEPMQAYLVSASDQGFLLYGTSESTNKHEIEFYNNNLKKAWTSKAPQDDYKFSTAMEAFQNDVYAASIIYNRKGLMSKDIDSELLVQQIADGKELFKVPLVTSKYSIMLSDVSFNKEKQQFVVFGEYYDVGDKEGKSQSLGFIALTLDKAGKIVSEKTNSWAGDISKVTPVNEKGKFEGLNANILFHDFVKTSDGKIFAIGEQYKKAASGAGIAANVLSGGRSGAANVQLNIYNMVLFEFDQNYAIKKLYLFEKDKNVFMLPSGAGYSSSKALSYFAKAYGGFDYSFTQASKNAETFVVAYINYDKEKGERAKNVLGSIVYTPEKTFTVDKLPLNRKSTDYSVFRAKEGYIMVTEYFKKEKRLESRLEKINY